MDMLIAAGPWTRAQLQDARALVSLAVARGADLRALAAALQQAVDVPGRPLVPGRLCPSCGHGPLTPVANSEGLRILGCRLCRYSEVV